MPAIHRVSRLGSDGPSLALGVRRRAAEPRSAPISPRSAPKRRRCGTGVSCSAAIRCSSVDCFRADYFEADFASFLAWRDWGFPDKGVFNGFGMGALRGSDGAFVLGEMAANTANAGRIYFPSGMSDPCDVRDGAFDIAGSIMREVEEETGLDPSPIVPTRAGIVSPPGR